MLHHPERVCSHRPLDMFRNQVKQCQQTLAEKQEKLSVFPQQFIEGDIATVNKALCNEVLSYLAQSREALQTLQKCFDEAQYLPLVLPLCYILPTNIRYTISCISPFEREITSYRATRRSSLVKRAEMVKNIESHFHTWFLNLEELLSNLSICLDQTYFEENALMDRQSYRPQRPSQLTGRIIPLRRSSSAYASAEKGEQDCF